MGFKYKLGWYSDMLFTRFIYSVTEIILQVEVWFNQHNNLLYHRSTTSRLAGTSAYQFHHITIKNPNADTVRSGSTLLVLVLIFEQMVLNLILLYYFPVLIIAEKSPYLWLEIVALHKHGNY